MLKYPVSYCLLDAANRSAGANGLGKPPKSYLDSESEIVNWLLEPFSEEERIRFQQIKPPEIDTADASRSKGAKAIHKTLDCSIMDVADEISYGVHDLEDGIQIGMIQERHLTKSRDIGQSTASLPDLLNTQWGKSWKITNLVESLCDSSSNAKIKRKTAIGSLVHALIGSIELREDEEFRHPLLKYRVKLNDTAEDVLRYVNNVALKEVIGLQSVQTLEYRGRVLVEGIFKALLDQPEKLLPEDYRSRYRAELDSLGKRRVICDYVAGMTDSYATKFFERLYIPRLGNVFERL